MKAFKRKEVNRHGTFALQLALGGQTSDNTNSAGRTLCVLIRNGRCLCTYCIEIVICHCHTILLFYHIYSIQEPKQKQVDVDRVVCQMLRYVMSLDMKMKLYY